VLRTAGFVALALAGFAANSLLCRQALSATTIDPVAFTALRLASGALVLALVATARDRTAVLRHGDWRGAFALFAYAMAFAWAYTGLDAGVGALLLFGAVQLTMLAAARWRGERFSARQWTGFALAAAGLAAMKLPVQGVALPTANVAAMLLAGAAWGAYTLLGRAARAPMAHTAGNFLRATPLALLLLPLAPSPSHWPLDGVLLALASGTLASGAGYALWYAALPRLLASQAALLQLLVPVLAAIGGIALLHEVADARLASAGLAIVIGIALGLWPGPSAARTSR
jgi:drug/metabolite transporter (DMT)-like permease